MPPTVIYVDLDGTVLRGDSLYEGIREIILRPSAWISIFPALLQGKASFKKEVSRSAPVRPETFVYRKELLEWLSKQHSQGRVLVLATGADHATASAVAEYLGIFSAVLASDGCVNLTGEAKLAAIQAHAQGGEFCYVGDGAIDLKVWQKATSAVLVGGAVRLEASLGAVRIEARFPDHSNRPKDIFRLLRPYQWAKNALVFLPALAAHRLFEPPVLLVDLLLFAAFSLCASGVYAANDLIDLSNDRAHSYKRDRPLASGAVTIPIGVTLALMLPLLSLGLAWLGAGWSAVMMLAGYWTVTTYYSINGKKIPLLDVFLLAGLYTFRAFAGALTVPAGMSGWMGAFLLFLFFGLACLKRFSELISLPENHEGRLAGRGYRREDHQLMGALGVGAGFAATLVVCLYANSSAVQTLYHEPLRLMALAPLVLFGLGRLWLYAWRGELHVDPVLHALKDWVSYLLLMLCALVMFLASRA